LVARWDTKVDGIAAWFDTFFEIDGQQKAFFSTSPTSTPTHWKQTFFYFPTGPVAVRSKCFRNLRRSPFLHPFVLNSSHFFLLLVPWHWHHPSSYFSSFALQVLSGQSIEGRMIVSRSKEFARHLTIELDVSVAGR
jgi:hypothetical protein